MKYLVVLIAVGTASCLGDGALPADDISFIGDATPMDEPSLSRRIPFAPRRAGLGWGSFDFAAHPEDHEFRVSLIVGERAPTARWQGCRSVEVAIDGRSQDLSPSYLGVPMEDGVFDAVSLELSIEDVRAMARSRDVSVSICGDQIAMDAAELPGLRDFVRRFEKMATYDGPPPPDPPPSGSVHKKPSIVRNSRPCPA